MAERTKDEHDKVQAAIKASFEEMIAPAVSKDGTGRPVYNGDRFHAWAARNNCIIRKPKGSATVQVVYYDAGFVYRLSCLCIFDLGDR